MKAYVLYGINDLCYEEIDYPECPSGWVVVKVKAAGICSSDIPRIFTKGTYHFPTIPGHEFSGIVDSVADEKNKGLIGKRVGVFPLIPCKECEQCKSNHYEMCVNYDYIGSRRDGAFAEYVAVPVWNLIELPDTIDFTEAAMLEPLAVAIHAVKLADVKEKTVAVIGTGMIGIAAAQIVRACGAKSVTVIGRNEEKRALVENNGLEYIIQNSRDESSEYDVVLEAVGSQQAIDLAINCTIAGGKIVVLGNPEGDIQLSQNTYWKILRRQLVMCGTWNFSYEYKKKSDWTEAIDVLVEEGINAKSLISHVLKQEELVEGLCMMKEHKETYCKVMMLWNDK